MKIYDAYLTSVTPYGQGRYHDTPKLDREGGDEYEQRTWKCRLHTAAGHIYIPPMAFMRALQSTAQYLKLQIPGRGKETYTKNFRQGVLCNDPLLLPLTPEDVRLEKVFTSAQPGKGPNGPRVWRYFPVIDQWEGNVTFWVIDDIITQEVLHRHLELAGMITGIGVWRPQNGGMWGKFRVLDLTEKAL